MKFNHIDTIIGISDEERYYLYGVCLVDGILYLLLPECSPEKFDNPVYKYNLHVSYYTNGVEHSVLERNFDGMDALACTRVRSGNDYFNEYVELGEVPTDTSLYLSLRVMELSGEDLIENMNFNSGQGCITSKCNSIVYIPCVVNNDGTPCLSMRNFPLNLLTSMIDFSVEWKYKIKVYVIDDVNCYDLVTTGKLDLQEDTIFEEIPMKTVLRKFSDVPSYKPGLRLQVVINVYDHNGDLFMTFRSIPYLLTPDTYARYLCDNTDDPQSYPDEEEIDEILKNMNILRPRIVNQTVQNVINMQSATDSKSHIVQPVFFRVRPLASCVFHPQVTENVCINLDAYKSSVESFRLKLEGVIFPETARVTAGVVFQIQGNLLDGQQDEGIYYILNENSELVTTGNYTYEY